MSQGFSGGQGFGPIDLELNNSGRSLSPPESLYRNCISQGASKGSSMRRAEGERGVCKDDLRVSDVSNRHGAINSQSVGILDLRLKILSFSFLLFLSTSFSRASFSFSFSSTTGSLAEFLPRRGPLLPTLCNELVTLKRFLGKRNSPLWGMSTGLIYANFEIFWSSHTSG